MDCKAFTEHLEFYLDRELGEPERTEVQEHALACTSCGAAMSKQREFRGRLRSSANHAALPGAMAARLEASLMKQQPIGAAAQPARNYRPYLLAAAALLLASAALRIALRDDASVTESSLASRGLRDWVAPQRSGSDPLVVQSAAWHQRNVPVEVTGPNQASVENWFSGKVDFPLHMPRLGRGATLLGGRMTTVANRPAALLFYDVDGTKLSVLVTDEASGERGTPLRVGKQRSLYLDNTTTPFAVATERRDGLTYAYTSNLPSEDLVRLVTSD